MKSLTQGHQIVIHRAYTAPTKYNKNTRGTLWEVINEETSPRYYVQVHYSHKEPKWVPFGDLLEHAFSNCTLSRSFMKKIIELGL